MPNRSASSMTMTDASGMSTPTSMTVVATSTSVSPDRNDSMARSLSAGFICPWSRPIRSPANSFPASRSASAVADDASTLSDPSTSAQTTKAR